MLQSRCMADTLWRSSLHHFQNDVAAAHGKAAAVAIACVTAVLGLSILIKALRIKGDIIDLVPDAERLILELRAAADADAEALQTYIQTHDSTGIREVPAEALRLVQEAYALCEQAAPLFTGLFAADVTVAAALVQGAREAIGACIVANRRDA